MAYVQFNPLLTEDAETVWDAEWFTDDQAKEQFGDVTDYPDLYAIALTDEEVAQRNDTAATYWDFVSGDLQTTGADVKR